MPIKTLEPICRGQSSEQEKNDCTVRALANATGMPYAEAHALLSKHGRRFRRGAYFEQSHAAYTEAGLQFLGVYGKTHRALYAGFVSQQDRRDGVTLGRLVERLPVAGTS